MRESEILHEVLNQAALVPGLRLARMNSGKCQLDGRWLHMGIHGAPDLIGYKWVLIKPEHRGLLVPVPVGIELKTPRGHCRPHQAAFLRRMREDGCLAGVAHSWDQASGVLDQSFGIDPGQER